MEPNAPYIGCSIYKGGGGARSSERENDMLNKRVKNLSDEADVLHEVGIKSIL